MSLLGFIKGVGSKLFNKAEDAPAAIKEHIESDNPGIENLEVRMENGVVHLQGSAKSQEALEKAVLIAGNVEGVGEVQYDGLVGPESTVEIEYYEIAPGDTLSAISKKFYNNANEYMKIFEANREVIKDPDKIYVGQKIRIPK